MTYTTEKLLEILQDAGYKAFKKLNRNTIEYGMLQRHQLTIINGIPFNGWKEYVDYKMVEYLRDNKIECWTDNGQIHLSVDDSEQQELNRKLYTLLKKEGIV